MASTAGLTILLPDVFTMTMIMVYSVYSVSRLLDKHILRLALPTWLGQHLLNVPLSTWFSAET